ncbi:S-adenosylmethionine:tRNA ribosyltransferase-isomerase [bacterium]|nr:MAG: S-adenosylmethionine:tRNA ribosyltransferase-isomerase [bacterium]
MRYTDGTLHEDIFKNIVTYLPAKSRIFFNNSRVIPARLIFPTHTGSRVEIFCLQPVDPSDYFRALSSTGFCKWECMIGNAKRFKKLNLHRAVNIEMTGLVLTAEKADIKENMAIIKFSWNNSRVSFSEIISSAGMTPLPPYIKRAPIPEDRDRYQTIYSKIEGSVAAPTAGLHFTREVLNSLTDKKIEHNEITLHVGAGTFQPVKTQFAGDHKMHAEYFEITRSMIEGFAAFNEGVTCVGTTTVRAIESMYWIGAKLASSGETPQILHLEQWEPYSLPEIPLHTAFDALVRWFEVRNTDKVLASTSFMIVPGYRFKITERLITNFHQPGSSLLMLIAAFIGDGWKDMYEYALEMGFRFLSFGDSSLLFKKEMP